MLFYLQMIDSDEERRTFEQLYIRYRQLLFYIAKGILHNDQDAEDAVHQAFLSIMENLKNLSDITCPKTKAYCVVVVENKAIDILRSRKRISPEELSEAVGGVEIPLPGDSGLADAMAKLPARYREALLLRYYFGYSTREMEKQLGLTRSAVLKLLWRAKEALRRQLEKEGMSI